MIAKTLWACVAIILISYGNAEYDVAKYCELVAPYTKLASLTSCRTYYICQPNGKPIEEKCPISYEFSTNTQSCVPATSGRCTFDPANPCFLRNDEYSRNAQGCNMWHYCKRGYIVESGSCPLNQIFDPIVNQCIPGECINLADGTLNVGNLCEIMPQGWYFGDSKDCNAWYECQGFSLTRGHCRDDLVFDLTTGMCRKNKGRMCQRTNYVVGTPPAGPPSEACTSVHQVIADTRVCSVYYVCRPSANASALTPAFEWVERNCLNQFFDVMSKKCISTSLARPYPSCDRCKFTTGYPYWVNAVSSSCSDFYICNQGKKDDTPPSSCGPRGFFNEASQRCIYSKTTLDQYEMSHGACQDYLCNEDRECSFVDNGAESSSENSVGDEGENNTGGKN